MANLLFLILKILYLIYSTQFPQIHAPEAIRHLIEITEVIQI